MWSSRGQVSEYNKKFLTLDSLRSCHREDQFTCLILFSLIRIYILLDFFYLRVYNFYICEIFIFCKREFVKLKTYFFTKSGFHSHLSGYFFFKIIIAV